MMFSWLNAFVRASSESGSWSPRLNYRQQHGSDAMSMTSPEYESPSDIVAFLADYILSQHPSNYTVETLPRDESLLDLGILDSAGVIEFLVFVESKWGIEISDEDLTKERMGSLIK